MRREILFRGKRVDNGEWVEGYLADENYINVPFNDDDVNGRLDEPIEIYSETVCEYTGSTDKNGRKIFEGDIVRYIDEVIEKEKVDEVKYNETHAAFCRLHKSKMGLQYLWLNEAVANKCEVIGNIFDNPELLGSRLKE